MLKKETEKIWQTLQGRPELRGFVLVGGSALALHLHHRESEDLDFAYTQARLPKVQLELLRKSLPELRFEPADSPIAIREADDCGLDLGEFSQNFVINDLVKVTFFALESAERKIVSGHADRSLELASVDEIFGLKALVCAKRSKTRDWFDLYVLMKDHGYTFERFYQVFVAAGVEGAYDIAANRLCSSHASSTDEGFHNLLPDPPKLEEMSRFFTEKKNAYEQKLAERAARKKL